MGVKQAAFRGMCPICLDDYAITQKGLVGKHPASEPEYDDGTGRCRGSGKQFRINIPTQNC
jgi:hypothetical protein